MMTTQKQVRRAFWNDNPGLSRRKITSFDGKGKMYTVDTRCAFVDFVDYLQHSGKISEALADKVTLC